MEKELTRKQKTFVKEYVATGNGTQSALKAYEIESPQAEKVASVIASENLAKPSIQGAIQKRLSKELVQEAHESLLTAVRLDYFVFPKAMNDLEIIEHVEAQGLTCLNVRPTEKGKMAFFSLPDGAARGKGIELFHKVEGTFAPDKHVNVNVEVAASPEVIDLTKRLNDIYRGTGSPSNGGAASSVGSQTSDQE